MRLNQQQLSYDSSIKAIFNEDAPAILPLLLPGVNDTMLLQAINELIEYSKGDQSKLERRLLWLGTFLRRADVMPPPEKQRVLERLKMFDELLEQDEFVQKQRKRALQGSLYLYDLGRKAFHHEKALFICLDLQNVRILSVSCVR